MEQNELNRMLNDALKGILSTIQSQQRQIESLGRVVALHQEMLSLISGSQDGASESAGRADAIRESSTKAAAEIAELERLHDLESKN